MHAALSGVQQSTSTKNGQVPLLHRLHFLCFQTPENPDPFMHVKFHQTRNEFLFLAHFFKVQKSHKQTH